MKHETEKQKQTATQNDEGTPLYRHYMSIQKQSPDTIIFYRLGDFYEVIGDNAKVAAEMLNLTLTGRIFGTAGCVYMFGVPYKDIKKSIQKLKASGLKAITVESFEYNGIHFIALRNLTTAEINNWNFTENLNADKLLLDDFDYEDFYRTAPRKDIFYCVETSKCYIPIKSSNSKGHLLEYKKL